MWGFYWVLGEGSTRNSGGYQFDGTGGSQPWFIPGSPFTNGWSLTTTVNNGQTTGCPCDPAVADPGGRPTTKPRLIEKPKKLRQR